MDLKLMDVNDKKKVTAPSKKVYQSPHFIRLGSLKSLTQGGNGEVPWDHEKTMASNEF